MKVWKMFSFGMALFFCLIQVSCALGHGLIPLQQSRMKPGLPDNAEAHYRLAGFFQERGRHREAIAEFGKVIAINPAHVKAYNGLGVSYTELKEYGPAMQAYARALAIDPGLDYVYNNMGFASMLQGYTDEAIASFEKALALNSSTPRIHNNLGLAYLAKGYPDKALAELARDKGEAWALCRMGEWYYQYDRFTDAMEYFARALDKEPALREARQGLEASETQVHMAQALAENPVAKEMDKAADITSDAPTSVATSGSENQSIASQIPDQTVDSQENPYDYYVIKKGEYLVKILRTVYGLITDKQIYHQYMPVVLELNPEIRNPNQIYPGQRICMPKPDSTILTRRQPTQPKTARMTADMNLPDIRPEGA